MPAAIKSSKESAITIADLPEYFKVNQAVERVYIRVNSNKICSSLQ